MPASFSSNLRLSEPLLEFVDDIRIIPALGSLVKLATRPQSHLPSLLAHLPAQDLAFPARCHLAVASTPRHACVQRLEVAVRKTRL